MLCVLVFFFLSPGFLLGFAAAKQNNDDQSSKNKDERDERDERETARDNVGAFFLFFGAL